MRCVATSSDRRRPQPRRLRRPATTGPAAAEAAPGEAWSREQIENALAELRTTLTDLTSEAEDAIAKNPLLAIGAAFLLGVVAGRLSKRI